MNLSKRNISKMKWMLLAGASVLPLLLGGCGIGSGSGATAPVTVLTTPASGRVMGGQQPVADITLQLYAVGTTGYGSAATPLLPTSGPDVVMTTAAGNFTLPTITCPSNTSLVYLVGTGGQPSPGTTNNNLALMVGLGACSSVGSQFIDMNEVTTVASVWALSPFMTGIANVGSSAANLQGIENAFASINEVANTTNGAVSGPSLPTNATLPTQEIITLADILAQCVNSSGGLASGSTDGVTTGNGCAKLFYLTTLNGTAPSDTITAAMNIAQHPGQNVSDLNLLASNSSAFETPFDITSSPTDWTIAITYTGGGLSTPQAIATDQSGNVWVANSGNSSVSEFNNLGAAQSGAGGYTVGGLSVPYAIAIDQNGNAWVANENNSTITMLSPGGASGTVYSGNGLSAPKSIAIDGSGNVIVGNSTSASISVFTSTGAVVSGSPFTSNGDTSAVAVNPR